MSRGPGTTMRAILASVHEAGPQGVLAAQIAPGVNRQSVLRAVRALEKAGRVRVRKVLRQPPGAYRPAYHTVVVAPRAECRSTQDTSNGSEESGMLWQNF